MPESKGRKQADEKRKQARKQAVKEKRTENKRNAAIGGGRQWALPTLVTLLLLGVAWLVVWYLTTATGIYVPGMSDLGNWNMLIAIVLMGSSFAVATQWK